MHSCLTHLLSFHQVCFLRLQEKTETRFRRRPLILTIIMDLSLTRTLMTTSKLVCTIYLRLQEKTETRFTRRPLLLSILMDLSSTRTLVTTLRVVRTILMSDLLPTPLQIWQSITKTDLARTNNTVHLLR